VIWSKYPQLTCRQVGQTTATVDGKQTVRDAAVGYGRINIGAR